MLQAFLRDWERCMIFQLFKLKIFDRIEVRKYQDLYLILVVKMMNVNIALLRAINVGGHSRVSMSDLRSLLTSLKFTDVKSLLQTGNLVFRNTGSLAGAEIEQLLESEAAKRLGLKTEFMVRTTKEIVEIIIDNPFPEFAESDPGHLVVLFLKNAVEKDLVLELQARVNGPEVIRAHNRELYVTYPEGIARSRLTSNIIESKLKTRGTGRNWNTLLKLRDLAIGLAGA